ncbi:Acyl-CoA hydrolase [Fontimonas thermophila]|uniref:Acyl-CoA hydrolase n=1 Tax=Fontimonas thermophila TaxID=1076937 RepID=A0A1I2JEH7_9GAMM|nr:acyl-CoA thioesterase [Fontimonas thermophila]SFF52974.1 Acyl-CoA hydrolase [Fontimonas thermophila]
MTTQPLQGRTVAYSAVREQVYMVFPNDLNSNDTVFGGLIMAQMDRFAAVVADRHAGGVCVTASVDAVHFIAPAKGGDVLIFNCSVNRAWQTSMEIGCKVEAERIGGGERRHILSAYLTFVAVDREGKPRPVPPVIPETVEERHRYEEAQLRRELRLRHAEALKALRAARPAG